MNLIPSSNNVLFYVTLTTIMNFLVNAYYPKPLDIVTSNLTQMHRSRDVENTGNISCDLYPKVKVI